jgi:ABC-type nitrate/sulfonate/bicarbonate transport system substrate-binding protein
LLNAHAIGIVIDHAFLQKLDAADLFGAARWTSADRKTSKKWGVYANYKVLCRSFGCFCLLLVISAFGLNPVLAAGAPKDRVSSAYTTIGGILTPFWISHEKGIFQKYGLDVSLKFISSGPVIVSALVASEVDITTADAEPIVSAILEGAELTIIGFVATTPPLMLYVQPAITQMEQLKGGIVAVSRLTSSSAYMLKVGLRQAGLEPIKDVTVIQAGGIPEAFAALQGGEGPRGDALAANDIQGGGCRT